MEEDYRKGIEWVKSNRYDNAVAFFTNLAIRKDQRFRNFKIRFILTIHLSVARANRHYIPNKFRGRFTHNY